MRKLPRYVAETKIGKKVDLVVWRKGKEVTISTKVGELPGDEKLAVSDAARAGKKAGEESNASPKDLVLGMQLVPITPQLRAQFQLKAALRGLIVDAIEATGEAAKRGLRPGDILVDANQQAIETVEDLRGIIKDAKKAGHEFVLLRVMRGLEVTFVTMSVR
jgi:serine protease Do